LFTELNSVEPYLCDLLCGPRRPRTGEPAVAYGPFVPPAGLGWTCVPAADLPRAPTDVLVEPAVRAVRVRGIP